MENEGFESDGSNEIEIPDVEKGPNGSRLELRQLKQRRPTLKFRDEVKTLKSRQSAVFISGACKKFGKSTILKDLNMNVKEGTIYALLGSSGCGKTTLLSCIVGIRGLDSGVVRVYGSEPGTNGVPGKTVGFMPQDIALYGEFTIRETLQYFGRIYGLTMADVEERASFLVRFLELPKDSREIRTMSGGQQRRVSFAVALVHKPKLLVLDEPTVGVDPILRQCIWEHLCQLAANESVSVIITTHYIEEANEAHMVGIMRNGRLLAEDSPESLRDSFEDKSLEQVVLSLCRKDEEDPNGNYELENRMTYRGRRRSSSIFGDLEAFNINEGSKWTMRFDRLRALVIKNFICMWRNVGFIAVLFVMPAIELILICLTLGGDPRGLKLGIINNEVESWDSGCFVPPSGPGLCPKTNLSCRLIREMNNLNGTLLLEKYDDVAEAIKEVKNGRLWGYLSFPANYSKFAVDRAIAGNFAEDVIIKGSTITSQLDMSNQQVSLTIKRKLYDVYKNYTKRLFYDCELEEGAAEHPIIFDTPIFGTEDPNFTEFVAPGLAIIEVLIAEKKGGMLERAYVAGVTPTEVIAGHIITQYVVMLGQTAFTLVILIMVFKVPVNGPLYGVILIIILQSTCGMFFGLVFTTICDDLSTVMQLTIGYVLPNALLSGVIWPRESMPEMVKYLSLYLPETLACEAIRSMMTRGLPITHSTVWPGFALTFIWTFIFIFLIWLLGKINKNN